MINQCMFCKYKNNKDECNDKIFNDHNWNCPTISNIYYGKIIKWFPFNIIDKIISDIKWKSADKYYSTFNEDGTENEEMKHIWGIKSYMDLSNAPCGLLTMNNFDITYLKKENKYILGVETMIHFEKRDGCKSYILFILDKFTEWMKENNYDTNKELCMYEVFTEGLNINSEFDDIETAYATFKLLAKGFNGDGL